MNNTTHKWVGKIVDKIKWHYDPDKIILFGSVAKNTDDANSDIDLLIIKPTTVPKRFRGAAIHQLLENYPIKMDLLFYTPKEVADAQRHEHSFLHSVLKKGKILYTKL